jgi:LysM repeat protein
VLDHGRIVIGIPALRSERSTAQVALVALLGVAFALIILARVTGGGGVVGAGDASPTPVVTESVSPRPASGRPSARPTATTAPGVSAPPTGSAAPRTSAEPSSSPAGSSAPTSKTYKVKAGDTLIGIAAKFGTTPKAIATLNGLGDLSSLKIGQVLKIP